VGRDEITTTRRHDDTTKSFVSLFEGLCPLAATALRAVAGVRDGADRK